MTPLSPDFIRASPLRQGTRKIVRERRECLFGGAALALVRACAVALMLSSLAFPAGAAASKRFVPPRTRLPARLEHAFQHAFEKFVASLWPLAEQRGVSRSTFDRAFAGVSFDPKVVAMTAAQPEFVRPIWDYVASAVSADRVERGRKKADAASAWLAKAEQTYGVDQAVILGVWGLETDYGGFVGSNSVIRALATLAYYSLSGRLFP